MRGADFPMVLIQSIIMIFLLVFVSENSARYTPGLHECDIFSNSPEPAAVVRRLCCGAAQSFLVRQ